MPRAGAGFFPSILVPKYHLSGQALSREQQAHSDRSILCMCLGPCCDKEPPGQHFHKLKNSSETEEPCPTIKSGCLQSGHRERLWLLTWISECLPGPPGIPRGTGILAGAAGVAVAGTWFEV